MKPTWPETFFLKKKATRRQNINQVLNEKAARTRKGILAELLAEERKEIRKTQQEREQRRRERLAVDAAATEYVNKSIPVEIVRGKDGKISLKPKIRGDKGRFLPSVKVSV